MLDRYYWRASYNEERDSFVVEQAGWIDGEPRIEYRFTYYPTGEEHTIARKGGLDKWWLDDDNSAEGEFFSFGKYNNQDAFETDVESILHEADQRAQNDNLDFFLAVIDIIKERAIEKGLEDEAIFSFEGLYRLGNEDAYSIRPYEDARLHNHVERTNDECWRLHIARVVDLRQKVLGWSLCVVLFPTLSSEAVEDEIDKAEIAQFLELKHFRTYGEAIIAVNGTQRFMLEEGRVKEPDYAFMDDSEVFELMSVQSSDEHKIAPAWDMLEGSCLRAFLDGKQSLVRTLEHWHPRQEDTIAQAAEAMGLPLHTADQLYTRMLESMKISEPWEMDSPWRTLQDEDDGSKP